MYQVSRSTYRKILELVKNISTDHNWDIKDIDWVSELICTVIEEEVNASAINTFQKADKPKVETAETVAIKKTAVANWNGYTDKKWDFVPTARKVEFSFLKDA